MDTSGYIPQLGEDDPLFEIAEYTQLIKEALEGNRVAVSRSSSDQALTTGAKTAISWGSKAGTAAMHSSGNATRLVALVSGVYRVTTTVVFSNVSGGFRSVSIRPSYGGSDIELANTASPSGTYNNAVSGSSIVRLTANQYIEIVAEVLSPASSVVARYSGGPSDQATATRCYFEYIAP